MVVHKSRGAARQAKRRNTMQLRGRVVRLLIGASWEDKREFYVHENQLCSHSLYFRARLQPGRKDIEGDCTICTEPLSLYTRPLTWYKACGNNAHENCIRHWTIRKTTPACPMCRAPWIMSKDIETITLEHLEAEPFEIYVHWIYTGTMPVYEEDITGQVRFERMMLAHRLGERVQDTAFVNDTRRGMCIASIEYEIGPDDLLNVYNVISSRALIKFCLLLSSIQGKCSSDWIKDAPRGLVNNMAELLSETTVSKEGDDIWTRLIEAGYLDEVETNEEEGEVVSD